MAMRLFILCICLFPALLAAQEFRLAPPKIYADSIFFLRHAEVKMAFDLDRADILYTTDGSIPVSGSDVYNQPFPVNTSASIQAVSRHPDYISSRPATLQLVKAGYVPDSTRLLTQPDPTYVGRKAATLFDLQKGSRDIHDGRWLGFRKDTVTAEAGFARPVQCRQIIVSTLSDPGAWIFPPRRVEVYGAAKGGKWELLGSWAPRSEIAWKNQATRYELFQEIDLSKTEVQRIRVVVIPYGYLPSDHPGAGNQAWLFLDEIIFQ